MPYYYCSLPNDKTPGRVPFVITDDAVVRDTFIHKWDVPGRGVYWCPNPLKPGATTRSLENLACVEAMFADIDFRDVEASPEEVDAKLGHLPLEVSFVNNSGRGRHPYWVLKEPIDTDDVEAFEHVRQLQKNLAAALSADPAPAHPAALMRYPGTHNSKCEPPVQVSALWGSNAPVDISELEALLDLLPSEGMFIRKANGHAGADGQGYTADLPGPIDIEARLENMRFEGEGDRCIHATQVSVTAALLNHGVSWDEATREVLEATERAVAGDVRTANWNWQTEEHEIRRMCADWITKHPELSSTINDDDMRRSSSAARRGRDPLHSVFATVGALVRHAEAWPYRGPQWG